MFNRELSEVVDDLTISTRAATVGGMGAAVVEVKVFHGVDTASRRLQTDKHRFKQNYANLHRIIFNGLPANAGLFAHVRSIYAGVSLSLFSKMIGRGCRFGLQPEAERAIRREYKSWLQDNVSQRWVPPIIRGTAATFSGAVEAILSAPFDTLIAKAQGKDPDYVFQTINRERASLYRGWDWLVARNMVGSMFLFSIPTYVNMEMTKAFGRHYSWQNSFANSLGSLASCIVTNPIEVIKNRIQMSAPGVTGNQVIRQLIRDEGVGALSKGLWLRVLVVAPRLAFVKTLAEHLGLLLSAEKELNATAPVVRTNRERWIDPYEQGITFEKLIPASVLLAGDADTLEPATNMTTPRMR